MSEVVAIRHEGLQPLSSSPNPYNAPTAADLEPPEDAPPPVVDNRSRQPFWRQAAMFSFYSPFVAILMVVAISVLRAGRPLHPIAELGKLLLAAAIIFAGLILGLVGLLGASRRRRVGMSLLAGFGVLLNGAIIGACLWAATFFKEIR